MLYLDHNATSPMPLALRQALAEEIAKSHGNPSSLHKWGRSSRVALEDAREQVAMLISRDARGLHFCSGATEANASVLGGLAQVFETGHVISSSVEHPAVECALALLEKSGWEITRLSPNAKGQITVDAVLTALRPNTRLISLMWANNETGIVHPILPIAKAVKSQRPDILIHSDAVQMLGKAWFEPCTEIDFLSFSGHKIGALSGIGALWKRPDLDWPSLICGGPQEREFRGGTENLMGAISFGLAAQWTFAHMDHSIDSRTEVRDFLESELCRLIPNTLVNGSGSTRTCNTLSLSFEGTRADLLLMGLDLRGIALSSGSACSSGSAKPSRVLMQMGLSESMARSTLRISIGPETKKEDLEPLLQILPDLVNKQRQIQLGQA